MKRRRFLIGAGVAALFTRIPNVVAQSNHRKVSVADFLDRFGETDAAIQGVREQVYARCGAAETSLIGKAIFAVYQRDAKARSGA